MLEFKLFKNYFEAYSQSLIQSRIDHQFGSAPIDQNIYDAVIGHGQHHTDLIESIKKLVSR
jgi:hypothetical protein